MVYNIARPFQNANFTPFENHECGWKGNARYLHPAFF